jgi:hypothetical protein
MFLRVPRITAGTSGHDARAAIAKEPDFGREGPFREEHQRMTARRRAQHAPRIRAALVPVEALDELGPDASQQQARHGHVIHLSLDHEPEARRQRRRHHDAIEVTRMIRDHDALSGW